MSAQRAGLHRAVAKLVSSPEWRATNPRQRHLGVLPGDTVGYVLGLYDQPDTETTFLAVQTGLGLRVFRLTEVTPPDLPAIGGSGPAPEIAPPGGGALVTNQIIPGGNP